MMRFIAVASTFVFSLGFANASQDALGYRAICAPEVNLMTVDTMPLIYPEYLENSDDVWRKYGIFGIGEQFECSLSEYGHFTFMRVSAPAAEQDSGYGSLVLKRDGNVLFSMPYLPPEGQVFNVNRFVATYCRYDGEGSSSCSEVWLREPSNQNQIDPEQ